MFVIYLLLKVTELLEVAEEHYFCPQLKYRVGELFGLFLQILINNYSNTIEFINLLYILPGLSCSDTQLYHLYQLPKPTIVPFTYVFSLTLSAEGDSEESTSLELGEMGIQMTASTPDAETELLGGIPSMTFLSALLSI